MHIRIHPSLGVYLFCIALLSSYHASLSMMITLLIHEAAHYAAGRLAGEQIELLELTPFGGVMRRKRGTIAHKGLKGVFVHAAGPIGNYVCLLAAGFPMIQRGLPLEFLRSLILCNVSMLLLNLLPVLPLDGGHIVFCLGYYLFPIARLADVLSLLGIAVGIGGMLLCVYGLLFHRLLNCSLLIVSLYLIVCAGHSRKNLLAENTYAVIQEHLALQHGIKRLVCYQVAPDTPLFELVPYLKQGICVSFFSSDENKTLNLPEYAFCHALLTVPSATVREACLNLAQCQEKSAANPENACFPS